MKVAFIFPGQGSQIVGMGKELAEEYAEARQIFEQADEALDFPLSKLCWEGPEDELKKTYNTQPAILTCSVACMSVLRTRGIEANLTAGHSIGEYAALVAAGVMDFKDAVQVTRLRGKLMEASCPEGTGGMAAIMGIEPERVLAVCNEVSESGVAQPAAFNCPGQVVVAGHIRALTEVIARVKAEGARNATLLTVSGPFHSALMKDAQDGLKDKLQRVEMKEAKFPVVANVDAKPHTAPEEIRQNLIDQLTKPVMWQASVQTMKKEGVQAFAELGAGRVLSGLLRRIDRTLSTTSVRDVASLDKSVDFFKAEGYFGS